MLLPQEHVISSTLDQNAKSRHYKTVTAAMKFIRKLGKESRDNATLFTPDVLVQKTKNWLKKTQLLAGGWFKEDEYIIIDDANIINQLQHTKHSSRWISLQL